MSSNFPKVLVWHDSEAPLFYLLVDMLDKDHIIYDHYHMTIYVCTIHGGCQECGQDISLICKAHCKITEPLNDNLVVAKPV